MNRLMIEPQTKTKKAVKVTKPVIKDDHLEGWAHAGVALMAGMSAYLNGYANSLHASNWIMGATTGALIPAIMIILARVAAKQYKRHYRRLSYFTAGSGLGLLVLSIRHCALSLALLTSGNISWYEFIWALPMAITIDAGLVACEIATLGKLGK